MADDLVEVDRYFDQDTRYRLAFREFGTCLGIQCMSEEEDLQSYANRILESWRVRMDRTLSTDFTTDDLRPITRVMYAAALVPGGKPTCFVFYLSCYCLLLSFTDCTSIPPGISRPRAGDPTRGNVGIVVISQVGRGSIHSCLSLCSLPDNQISNRPSSSRIIPQEPPRHSARASPVAGGYRSCTP